MLRALPRSGPRDPRHRRPPHLMALRTGRHPRRRGPATGTPRTAGRATGRWATREALHATGREVRTAIVIGYELKAVPAGGEPVAAAMGAGKLMGLTEDQLANALTLALTPHVALNKGVGALSMWKGCRSAEAM